MPDASRAALPLTPTALPGWGLLLLILALAAAAFAPGLGGGFIFDDYPNILTNSRIHMDALSWDQLARAARAYESPGPGRSLATTSFALNHLVDGKDPFGYKLTNLLIHLVNAALVWTLLRQLARAVGERLPFSRPLLWAGALTLLWAAHPMQVSSVLYVVQRMELLAVTFTLLGLILYLKGRQLQRSAQGGAVWVAGATGVAALGLLGKETAVLFPAFALALELTVFRSEMRRSLRIAFALFAVAGLVAFAMWAVPRFATPDAYAFREFSLAERLLSQPRILALYVAQFFLPLPSLLTFYYDDYQASSGLLAPPATILAILGWLVTAVFAWRSRQRAPLFALGIMWFLAAHALTSNIFPLELVFEHRNYFAILGLLLSASVVFARVVPERSVLRPALTVLLAAGMLVLTLVRSAMWGDSLTLAMDLAAKNPHSSRASNDLAEQFMLMSDMNPDSPFYRMAMLEFERGAVLPAASILPEQGLLLMSAASGRSANPAWWDRLERKLRTRPVSPQDLAGMMGLIDQRFAGLALDDARLSRAAAIAFERGRPAEAAMYARYGEYVLTYGNDEALASRLFVKAIEHSPHDREYANRLAGALLSDGRHAQAAAVVERARALDLVGAKPTGRDQ